MLYTYIHVYVSVGVHLSFYRYYFPQPAMQKAPSHQHHRALQCRFLFPPRAHSRQQLSMPGAWWCQQNKFPFISLHAPSSTQAPARRDAPGAPQELGQGTGLGGKYLNPMPGEMLNTTLLQALGCPQVGSPLDDRHNHVSHTWHWHYFISPPCFSSVL